MNAEDFVLLSKRPSIRGQGWALPHSVRPTVGSTYRIQEWDDTWETVVVVSCDDNPQGKVEMKYVRDGLVHRVSEEYFVSTLNPTNVTTTCDQSGRIISSHDKDGRESTP
jgi:YD repeat-containing protein